MDGGGESNNNIKVFRRGLEDEDSSFSTMRSSLRARRDRLARREALLQTQEEGKEKRPSSLISPADTPVSTTVPSPSTSNFTRNSATRRSRLANEYSQPQVDTHDDETALSLISSSKILSMDDSSIRGNRGGLSDTGKDSPGSQTPTDPQVSVVSPAGEGGAMNSMRKSLPTNMRSRRTRRDLAVDDMRNRTPSRELIHNDINELIQDTNSSQSPLVNGSIGHKSPESSAPPLTNGVDSQSHAIERRKSLLDDVDGRSAKTSNICRNRSNSDFATGVGGVEEMEKPLVERTTSSSTVSAGGVPGETREERIARYKERRKAALAARTSQYLDSSADDSTAAVSGYVPRYLRNRDSSGASCERNRDDDTGSGYVPRWRRRNNNEDMEMASSSNASSITDLHVTRKDSSASSENSNENAPCKLTYENLKLHDKLSSAAPPYSSLSRLEEGQVTSQVEEPSKVKADDNKQRKYSNRKDSTNEITPTNSPALAAKSYSKLYSGDTERRASRKPTDTSMSADVENDTSSSLVSEGVRKENAKNSSTTTTLKESRTIKGEEISKAPRNVSDNSEMEEPARRGSVGLSDRLKKFESPSTGDKAPTTAKISHKPGKLDTSKFTEMSNSDDSSAKKLDRKFSPSNNSIHRTDDADSVKTSGGERKHLSSILGKQDSHSTTVLNEEPLLDPQLAAMLEARKIKSGESPVSAKKSNSPSEVVDVTSILKSRMRKREEIDGKKSTISVAARASFFAEEQQRVSEVNQKPSLDRHPSAKIPQVDQRDVEAKRAIGVKRAMLFKKRKRAATQPVTINEVIAAKSSSDQRDSKTHDDLDLLPLQPFRGRLLSVPTTKIEIEEVKKGSPPQKYVRPKEPPVKNVKKTPRKSRSGKPPTFKNVTSKVDSGKSVLTRSSPARSSVRGIRESKVEAKSTDTKAADQPNKFSRRSTSVRGASSAGAKAAAERAHVVVEARKAASPLKKAGSVKVGENIRARATAKVDSRRSSSHTQLNGSTKRLSVKVSDVTGSPTADSGPLSPASTASTVDRHTDRPRKLSISTVNSEDVPGYMRTTTASIHREKATPTPSVVDSGDELSHHPPKRRSGSVRELDSGSQPSYMKPTNSFAHRLEAKLDDLASPGDSMDSRPKSKPIIAIEHERGEQPSFMKPTARSLQRRRLSVGPISSKRVEKEGEDEKPRLRRAVSPTLPDGDLPSYMKATESYFKKGGNHNKVEHLFDEEPEETKPSKRLSMPKPLNDDELPSFMKPTKAFEAQVSIAVEESAAEAKPKRKLPVIDPATGEVPSYMKTTTAFEKRLEEDNSEVTSDRLRSNSSARLSTHTRSTTHSENGDIPSSKDGEHSEEKKRSVPVTFSNGEVPSFMKPTKSFEIRDRHNEEAQAQQEEHAEPERKVSVRKPRQSVVEGELPSYMKATKSHEIREHAIASGTVETTSLERALQGPMIDQFPEPGATQQAKPRKTSVGGFLRKKFGIGKGASVDSSGSTSTKGRKSSATKTTASNNVQSGSTTDIPSYMKPTTNSSQRTVSERRATSMISLNRTSYSSTDDKDGSMSTSTLTPAVNGSEGKTPLINVTQVSVDGQDVDVQLRTKKTTPKSKVKEDINSNSTSRSTIANRSASVRVRGAKAQSLLASLQVNGEESWKRRVGEKDHGSFRSGTIHDRLSKIEDSSKSWQKKKGQENDAKQFTVEGKMAKKGEVKVAPSPLMPRKEKVVGAAKRANSLRLKRDDDKVPTKMRPASALTAKKGDGNTAKVTSTTVVLVPDQDDAEEFFKPSAKQEDIEINTEDFDHIFIESANMLPAVTKIKPKRNKTSNSPNPYKALQMRQDIKSEYTETHSDIADKEMKRINKSKVAERATRTALAGLATKEDINKVALKKANHTQVMNPGGASAAPYRDLMLIQIKGRRHVEMRIVQPISKSVNSGDCFLLVTKNKIYQWMGEYANVMERSKAADLATYIQSKKDIGCTLAKSVVTIEETKHFGSANNEFWKLLGGSSTHSGSGPVDEDELYEDYMAETNSVYRVNGEELSPIDEFSGQIPRYDMLDDEQVIVFDFGTEVYAWCGKLTSMDQRKAGLRLAKMLYQSGYDYTECNINPMSPLLLPDKGGLPNKSDKRPNWTICGKVTANMETVLFKEKFFDWPEASRLIQAKETSNGVSNGVPTEQLKAFDVQTMLERSDKPVSLVLEHSNVGRGSHWVEYEDGIRREYQIDTLALRMWHVSASDYYELMEGSYGQLHSGDTYVVRWQYQIKQSADVPGASKEGVRNLKGNLSKHQSQMGRERCAYFFWQGAQSTVNEKGASAIMTIELDEEHGPQVRVEQGLEPACFLSLFKGRMMTHLGKRDDDEKQNPTKLYVVQHEHELESALLEVPCRMESLRSCGVFIYLNINKEILHLWVGSQASRNMKANGKRIAEWIVENCPMELGLSLESSVKMQEVHEGEESRELLTALKSNKRDDYHCLINSPSVKQDYVARMFHMTSVNLTFHVQELFLPSRHEKYTSFPFTQCQLYKLQQPTLVLLDFGDEVYLWHGWWPLGFMEDENVSTGSARSRYTEDRKLALETSLNYCKAREGTTPKKYCVYAGKEPKIFTNHFASWKVNEEAEQASAAESRPANLEVMEECFQRLSRSVYSFEELQQRPLPDGVNPNKLETYLSDEEFVKVLKMSRDEFASLPAWKQTNVRKESQLF